MKVVKDTTISGVITPRKTMFIGCGVGHEETEIRIIEDNIFKNCNIFMNFSSKMYGTNYFYNCNINVLPLIYTIYYNIENVIVRNCKINKVKMHNSDNFQIPLTITESDINYLFANYSVYTKHEIKIEGNKIDTLSYYSELQSNRILTRNTINNLLVDTLQIKHKEFELINPAYGNKNIKKEFNKCIFTNLNLSGFDFFKTNFDGCQFNKCTVSGCNFSEATFRDCLFDNCIGLNNIVINKEKVKMEKLNNYYIKINNS